MSIPNPYAEQGVIIPTTSTTTCVPTYVSVTINAGNSFVIPPGGSLVAVSDTNLVQSDCVDVNALEQKQCYKFKVSGACNDNRGITDPETENWEPFNTSITAFYIGSTKYSVTSVAPTDPLNFGLSNDICPDSSILWTNFQTALTETSLLGLIEPISYENAAGNCNCDPENPGPDDSRGWTIAFIIKTIPSVANTLMMELRTATLSQAQPSPAETFIRIVPTSITCPEI